jgi:hypothetical protein
MGESEEGRVHEAIDFVGLRAHATAVGLLQLCAELVRVGLIDDEAVTRIKDAIARDISLSRPRSASREEYESTVRRRLDALFAGRETLGAGPSSAQHPPPPA